MVRSALSGDNAIPDLAPRDLEPLRARFEALAEGPLPDWDRLAARIAWKGFERGQEIMPQGAPDRRLRWLAEGLVKLAYQQADGGLFTKSILEPGAVFASVSALGGGPTTFTAVAMAPAVVALIPFDGVEELMREHLGWERAARKLYADQAMRKERREFELLALSAEDRWLKLSRENPGLVARVTQGELVALVGVTPVALSRIKARGA